MKTKGKGQSTKIILESGKADVNEQQTRKRCARKNGSSGRRDSSGEMKTGLDRKGRISVNEIIVALQLELGKVTYTATRLGVSYTTLQSFIRNSKKLQRVLLGIKEQEFHWVMDKLLDKINKGDDKAMYFYLTHMGKRWGFGESSRQPMLPMHAIRFKYVLVPPRDYKKLDEKKLLMPPEEKDTKEEDPSEEE
jgi:hypothetical protein